MADGEVGTIAEFAAEDSEVGVTAGIVEVSDVAGFDSQPNENITPTNNVLESARFMMTLLQ